MRELHIADFSPLPVELKQNYGLKVVMDSIGDMGPFMAICGCELRGHSIEVLIPDRYLGSPELKRVINKAHAWLMVNYLQLMKQERRGPAAPPE